VLVGAIEGLRGPSWPATLQPYRSCSRPKHLGIEGLNMPVGRGSLERHYRRITKSPALIGKGLLTDCRVTPGASPWLQVIRVPPPLVRYAGTPGRYEKSQERALRHSAGDATPRNLADIVTPSSSRSTVFSAKHGDEASRLEAIGRSLRPARPLIREQIGFRVSHVETFHLARLEAIYLLRVLLPDK